MDISRSQGNQFIKGEMSVSLAGKQLQAPSPNVQFKKIMNVMKMITMMMRRIIMLQSIENVISQLVAVGMQSHRRGLWLIC